MHKIRRKGRMPHAGLNPGITVPEAEQKSDFVLKIDTPYLTLMGEL